MAKVVLVWNEHPTEVVAGFHCRKVAKLLREMGHEVIVEKIPARKTNYGIVSHENPKQAFDRLAALKTSLEVARDSAQKNDAFAFNFHASIPETLGQSTKKVPSEFQTGEYNLTKINESKEIMVFKKPGENWAIIELPGLQIPLRDPLFSRKKTKQEAVQRENIEHGFFIKDELVDRRLEDKYHIHAMPLKHPDQQKYLLPIISEKIAAAIHKRISRQSSR